MKKFLALFISAVLVFGFAACGKTGPVQNEPENTGNEASEISGKPAEPVEPAAEEFGERIEVSAENYKNAVEIVLADEITVGGKPVSESDFADADGEIIYYRDMEEYQSGNSYGDGEREDMHTEKEAAEHTVLTIRKPGEYFIRGELKGQIAVDLGEDAKKDPDAKVTLVFGGADINCEIAPAVIFYNVYECETLGKEASAEVDTSGAGAVVVAADGSRNNIRGSYVAEIYKDEPGEKKLHKYDAAIYSKMSMNIGYGEENTGILNIEAKKEGVGTEMHLSVNGGIININSGDDGINTNRDEVSVTAINGGKINVKGGLGIEGDGIDSNGWLLINGGNLYASGNGKSGDGGIDSDMGIIINGGNVVAFGSKNDYVDTSSAKAFAMFGFSATEKAGSVVEFVDEAGNTVKAESDREFRSIVLSGDMIEDGKNYKLYVDGIMQEYSSDVSLWKLIQGEVDSVVNIPKEKLDRDGNYIPFDANGKKSSDNVPEELDEWLEEENDIPEEIRVWIESMKDEPNKKEMPEHPSGEKNTEKIGLSEEIKDHTVFALSRETCFYSGICDSFEATGKTKVSFTVNGENRMEDIFVGDSAKIKSIVCSEKVQDDEIVITLEYSGRDESKTCFRRCVLSDGYDAINALFEGLPKGDYRFTVSVSDKNPKFTGFTEFNFDIVD